jgi:3',5'-cyclic AMP phosphodiesterase CpdA
VTRSAVIVALAAGAIACTDPDLPDEAAPGRDGGGDAMTTVAMSPFSIVVLPDTQFYSSTHPEIFVAQTSWIARSKQSRNIGFVLHEGDIVDTPTSRDQWRNAASALRMLDGVVPYVLAPGNHDQVQGPIGLTHDAPLLNEFFPASAVSAHPWPTGTFEPGRVQNHFQIIAAGGRQWLIVVLEFGPRDVVLAWADAVLRDHPALPAIIVTHAYMYLNNERYDRSKPGECNGSPVFWSSSLWPA